MDRNGKFTNGLNGLGEAYNGQDEAEVELAFQVHRAEPGDLSLLNSLVECYAAEVSRLAGALLTLSGYPLSLESATQTVVIRTFAYAIRHTDRFRGKASLRNWLLSITIRQTTQYQREKGRRGLDGQGDEPFEENIATNWEHIDGLPEKLHLVLILRYACALTVEDIGETLGVKLKQVHGWLVSGRRKLMPELATSHRSDELEAYVDGLLADDLAKRDELESHLPECEACDTFLARLRDIDQKLKNELQERWVLPVLTSSDFERVVQMIHESLPAQPTWRLPAIPLKQTAWMAGLLVLFAVTVSYMIAQQPEVAELVTRPTITPTVLPLVEAVQVPRDGKTGETRGLMSFTSITTDLSGDADSMAFVLTSYETNNLTETMISQHVYLYDRKNEALLEIGGTKESPEIVNWLYSLPSLSADGRYLTYSQTGSSNTSSDGFCQLSASTPCADIFIYDRQSGTTEQITHGLDGAPADGTSLAPRISADGRWVAFWSVANNLTGDDTFLCAAEGELQHCLDIFLYDRQEDRMIRIPVGANLSYENIGPDRISLSANGGLVGFTIAKGDGLAEQLGVQYEFQAVLYDREQSSYELVNQAADGIPGNGDSFGPVLSADGRILAFSSLASNLVESDTNEAADVFVVDRQTGTIERVSVNAFGMQVNGDSGVFLNRVGFYSLDLSDDGRYVTFLSQAADFGSSASCDAEQQEYCNALILHDRQYGSTELIRAMQNGSLISFPELSNDGRWISYVDILLECNSYQGMCMRTMLYDRQRDWMSSISEAVFPSAQAEWQRGEPINTPQKEVNILAVAPNNKYMAAVYGNKSIGIWNFVAHRWERTLQVKSDGSITSLAYDPNSEWLAAGTTDGVVSIWGPDGRNLYELKDHPGRVHTVLFSPYGNELFTGTPNAVWVWRRGEGKISLAYSLKYPEPINSIALSPSGNLLAAASNDKTVWLQLLPSGSLITRLGGQENVIGDVAFSADGSMLASSSLSGEVNLWKIDWKGFGALDAEYITSINGNNWYGKLAFSPDGRYLASGSFYEGIKLWDIHNETLASLYSLDPSQWILSTVAFSQDGSTLLAGSFGEVEVWRTYLTVAEPRYFQQSQLVAYSNNLALVQDWPSQFQLVGDSSSHLDLYLADELLPFDLLVPTSLPAQVHFVEAQLLQDGGVVLHYIVSNPTEITADLYILEHPLVSGETMPTVGQYAPVQEVGRGTFYAEYVQGDWRLGDVPTAEGITVEQWVWDGALPVQRLRLHYNQVSVSMFYQERATEMQSGNVSSLETPILVGGEWQPDFGLDKEDLIQIAQGVEALTDYLPGSTVYISYQVQEGDTCSGIAAYFGTSVEALASLNGSDADCNLIYAGQEFIVPLNSQRLDLDRADLDCDGQDERLQVVPALGTTGDALVYSVYLQAISDIGIHQDVWQLTAKGEESDYLSYPMLNQLYDCQIFVALRVIKAGVPELRVYRWADGQMKPVLEKGMDILALDSWRNTMKVREQVVEPASGVCQPWDVTYEWDGQQFVEIERIVDPTGGTCQ